MPPADETVIEAPIAETLPPTDAPQDPPADTPADAAPAAAPTPAPADAEPHTVPYGRYKAERDRLERKVQEEAQRASRIEGRLDEMARQFVERRPPDTPAPALDVDAEPIQALKQTQARLDTVQAELAEMKRNGTQQTEDQRQHAEFVDRYSTAARQFAAEAPDFNNAYQHWIAAELEDLQTAGYSPAQANQLLSNKERALAAKAFADGENPAARLFALAQRRGYTRSGPAANGAGGPPPAGAAGAPAPISSTTQARPMPTESDKLDTVARGAQQSRSVSQGSGGAPRGAPDLAAIAKMSDDEFGKLPKSVVEGAMIRHYATLPRER